MGQRPPNVKHASNTHTKRDLVNEKKQTVKRKKAINASAATLRWSIEDATELDTTYCHLYASCEVALRDNRIAGELRLYLPVIHGNVRPA